MKIVTTGQYVGVPPGSLAIFLHLDLVGRIAKDDILHAIVTNSSHFIQNDLMWEEVNKSTYLIVDFVPESERLLGYLLRPGQYEEDHRSGSEKAKSLWRIFSSESAGLNLFYEPRQNFPYIEKKDVANFYQNLGKLKALFPHDVVILEGSVEDSLDLEIAKTLKGLQDPILAKFRKVDTPT